MVVVIFVVILVIDELEELAPETKIVELRLNDELACNVTTTGLVVFFVVVVGFLVVVIISLFSKFVDTYETSLTLCCFKSAMS